MRAGAVAVVVLFEVVSAGCRARPVAKPAPGPAPVVTAPKPPARDPSDPWPWPYGMRVYTWTPDGIAQIGELPWVPPPEALTTPWYIESTGVLDEAKLTRVIAEVRAQRIPGLSLRGQPIAAHLGALRELPALTALVLDGTAVTGAELGAIDVSLERLYLSQTPVDDAAIAAAVARQPKLQVLALEDTAAGDTAAQAIARLGELRALNLSNTRLTDAGGAALRTLAKLEIVDLGKTRVGAKTVAALRELAIRELFLDGTRAGRELATLAGFAPGLRRFDVSNLDGYKPVDADLAWLARAPELIEVGLSASRVTDKLVLELLKLPNLTRLRLAAAPITIASIAQMAARGNSAAARDFHELDLAATPVDDASAALLIAGPAMQRLRLDRTPITDAALTAGAGPGIGLRELYLSYTKVTDTGLAILDRTPYLGGLGLAEARIGAATLERIARLRQLHTLVLDGVAAPPDALRGLGNLALLESLTLARTRTGDGVVAALAGLARLRVLHLDNTSISDASLAALRQLRLLEELTVGDTRVGAAIADLDAWPRLHTLSLIGLEVGDAILPALAKRRSLYALDLSATDVRDPAPLARLPFLRVVGLAQTPLSSDGLASAMALAARGVEVVR